LRRPSGGRAILSADAPVPAAPGFIHAIRVIDRITRWSGHAAALLVIPLVLANTIEVFMRHVLDRPTDWALETTVMAYGALFMLGAAYALQKGAHVRTDMFWEKFSDRTKGIIDSAAYAVLFLPSMAILFYLSLDELAYAWSIGERSNFTAWQPPLWPLRAVIPIAAAQLFLQGVSELLKGIWAARTGKLLVHHEKIEI
jgi:TRAP-type mannitol/chloroaromatic compound transport system permease small subunit